MELSNNTILITGGTSGIGYEFAAQLLALGNTVIITGRDQAKLDQTKAQLPEVHIFRSDVSNPASITTLYNEVTERFPNLNILINNAGEMRKMDLHDTAMDINDIVREIEINLSGPIRMVKKFLPQLQKVNNAAIINVTSGIAFVPFPLAPIYGATKSGLQSYTRSLRVQLKKDNIKVFELVAPGAKTPLNDKFEGDVDPKMLMEPTKLVSEAIKGLKNDKYQIFPGIAGVLAFMSRLAPNFIFNMMAKIAEKSLAQTKV